MNNIAPTLPTLCGSLPLGGAAAPAARQSRFRGPGLNGGVDLSASKRLALHPGHRIAETLFGRFL